MSAPTETSPAAAPEPQRSGGPGSLGPREAARFLWRRLTSMRTALVLLLLLALAAVPGSIVPQVDIDASRAARFADENPTLARIYDRLGLFDVYSTPWFAAIYVLLMISLVGCILPRCAVYWRDLRAKPPATPKRLTRLPHHRVLHTDAAPDDVLAAAREGLRGSGFRTLVDHDDSVSAERGKLREAGNLLFHLAILVVLVGFGAGSLYGYKGSATIVIGNGFANTLTQYDEFDSGGLFEPNDLPPFAFDVDDFSVTFIEEGRSVGSARDFYADLAIEDPVGTEPQTQRIRVNHPLSVDGTDIFLIGHGYAPRITVRDGDGEVVASGPTVFLPEGADFRSFGVVKAPDADPQIGLEGELYPTYAFTDETGPFSAFPDAKNPVLSLLAYSGDLGLGDGGGQSVYALDQTDLDPILRADGRPARLDIPLGGRVELPDDLGSVSFDGMDRFVRLQISSSPGKEVALGGTVLGLLGLMGSLFIRPRRAWVRARREDGRTVVHVAGLEPNAGGDLDEELDRWVAALRERLPDLEPSASESPGSSAQPQQEVRP